MIPPKVMAQRMVNTLHQFCRHDDTHPYKTRWYFGALCALYCCDIILKNNPMSDPTSSGEVYSMKNYFKDVRAEITLINRRHKWKKSDGFKKLPNKLIRISARSTSPSQDSLPINASEDWQDTDSDEHD